MVAPAPSALPPSARPAHGNRTRLRLFAWPFAVATAVIVLWWAVGDETAWTQWIDLTTFWWSLLALPLVVLALVRRDRRAAALFALPALLWVWAYGSAFLPPADAGQEADLRALSFNTFVGAPDEQHVLELVAETDADVLLLQEVFPPREAALRLALEGTHPFVHVDQSPGVGGVAVFSRFPIDDVSPVRDASDRSRTTSVVTLDVDGHPLQVVSLHLLSPCPRCGASVIERLELEDTVRRAEIEALLESLSDDVPVLVGADLNSNERSTPYRRLTAAGFDDVQRRAGRGPGFTWPADRAVPPVLRIDWLLTRGLVPVAAWVDDARASDHRPVIADLAFPDA